MLSQVKELDEKNGVKDDVVGRIVKAKNQRAIVDCTDANNNTPLSEAASKLLAYTCTGWARKQTIFKVCNSESI